MEMVETEKTQKELKNELHSLNIQIEVAKAGIMMLEAKREKLEHQIKWIDRPIVKITRWETGVAELECRECGKGTRSRKDGLPWCKSDAHRSDKLSKKEISDDLWNEISDFFETSD